MIHWVFVYENVRYLWHTKRKKWYADGKRIDEHEVPESIIKQKNWYTLIWEKLKEKYNDD